MARVYFCGEDAQHTYRLTLSNDRVALHRLDGSQAHSLAERSGVTCSSEFELGIRRAADRIVVALDGRAVLRCEDGRYHGKNAGVKCDAKGLQLKLQRVQPIGDAAFNDSFMRAESAGAWTPHLGYWELSSMKVATHSSNPFALFARFPGSPALERLHEGRTRRYTGIGVRVAYESDRAHVLAVHRDSPAQRAGIRAGDVIWQIDGKSAVETSRDDIVARILGRPGSKLSVTVRRPFAFRGRERRFSLERQTLDLDRVDTDTAIQPAQYADESLITSGQYFWTDYTVEAAARTLDGAFGVAFGVRDSKHYYALEWASALRLVRVWSGVRSVLAERTAAPLPNQHYLLRVSLDGPIVTAFVDDAQVLRAEVPELSWGRIGLYARDGKGAYFDDVRVEPTSRFAVASRALTTSTKFQGDKIMHKWADPKSNWQEHGGSHWHGYVFPGQVLLRSPWDRGRSLSLEVSAQSRRARSGYSLDVDGKTGRAELRRGEVTVATAHSKKPPSTWELERRGAAVTVRADGQAVAKHSDPKPLLGSLVRVAGTDVPLDKVQAESDSVLEYAFDRMPVDWLVATGRWGIMNRWICNPRWSWFGGRSKQLAAVWHKRAFDGDVSLDAFVGFEMVPMERGAFERTTDFGLTLCGDGLGLASGYALHVGGEGNRVTRLYRRGRVVAESRDKAARFPSRGLLGENFDVHRDWYHVHFSKQGDTIAVRLNEKPALTYRDPDPLPAGQTAVWVVNNGVLLARVRLAGTRVHEPLFAPSPRRVLSDGRWTNLVDGQVTAHLRRLPGTDDGYRIESLGAGPPTVVSVFGPIDLAQSPVLSFDCRIGADMHVDPFVDVRGVRHRIHLTGVAPSAAAPLTIGQIAGVKADGQWHRATFPVLASLRTRYPDWQDLAVERFGFAAPDWSPEEIACLTGNRSGAFIEIRGIEFGGAELALRAVAAPSEDRTPPTIRRVRLKARPVLSYDFEAPTDAFLPVGTRTRTGGGRRTVWVDRTALRCFSGRFSLQVLGTEWQPTFGALMKLGDRDLGKHGLLVFRCWVPPVKGAFSAEVECQGLRHSLWTWRSMAPWLRMPVDTFAVLKESHPNEIAYDGCQLRFTFSPEDADQWQGAAFAIDDVELWPILGPKDLDFVWDATDSSGIQAHRCALTRYDHTVPTSVQDSSTYASVGDGLAYFHLMVQDRAGNWSEPFHQPVLLDLTPPRAKSARVANGVLDIQIAENRGIDPRTIRVRLGDETLSIDDSRTWYDQTTGRLRIRLGVRAKRLFADHDRVHVQLLRADDFAGNALQGGCAWILHEGEAGLLKPTTGTNAG